MSSPYEAYFADLLIRYTANSNGLETRHGSKKDNGDRCVVVVVVADPASLPPSSIPGKSHLLFEKREQTTRPAGRSCFVVDSMSSSCNHAPPSQPTRKASHDNLLMLAIKEINEEDQEVCWDWSCDTTTSSTTSSTRGMLIETSRFNIMDDTFATTMLIETSRFNNSMDDNNVHILESTTTNCCCDTRRYPTGRRRSYSQVFPTVSGGRRHLPTRTGAGKPPQSSRNNSKENRRQRRRASFPLRGSNDAVLGEDGAISRWDTNVAPSSSHLERASRSLLNP